MSCKTEGVATGDVIDANGRLSLIIWSTLQTDWQITTIPETTNTWKRCFKVRHNFISSVLLAVKLLRREA